MKRAMFRCMPVPPPDAALGPVLRAAREALGLTQEDVSYEANLTTRSLVQIETGQSNPRWSTIRQIARALGLSLVELAKAVEDAES